MAGFDGSQKASGFGFKSVVGFNFKSPQQLSGADKEIVVPLSSDATEAEKAKAKQAKEDARVAEQYKIDQLKQQAKKLGFSENIIDLINSSDCKIDARAKTLTIKTDDGEQVFDGTKGGLKKEVSNYQGASGDDIRFERRYTGNGHEGTTTYYKKNDKGKFVKVARVYMGEATLHKTEIYDGVNVKSYDNAFPEDIDNSLMSKELFNYTYGQ